MQKGHIQSIYKFDKLSFKRTLHSGKNMNSLNVEYVLAMNIQNLDKNG